MDDVQRTVRICGNARNTIFVANHDDFSISTYVANALFVEVKYLVHWLSSFRTNRLLRFANFEMKGLSTVYTIILFEDVFLVRTPQVERGQQKSPENSMFSGRVYNPYI